MKIRVPSSTWAISEEIAATTSATKNRTRDRCPNGIFSNNPGTQ